MDRRFIAEAHSIDNGMREIDTQHAECWVRFNVVGIPCLARPVIKHGLFQAGNITDRCRIDSGVWRLRQNLFCFRQLLLVAVGIRKLGVPGH
jgi:hypothetical protein